MLNLNRHPKVLQLNVRTLCAFLENVSPMKLMLPVNEGPGQSGMARWFDRWVQLKLFSIRMIFNLFSLQEQE